MTTKHVPRLYRELSKWYRLLTPVEDYKEEAEIYRTTLLRHARRPVRTLLELGSGAGHNAFYLKEAFQLTLVDRSREMLGLSEEINPDCQHLVGDMRDLRLGRGFDAVFFHDAVGHLTNESDLASAIETAYVHCAPGGVALFCPDYTVETFKPGSVSGGSDGTDRAMRYLEWCTDPDPSDCKYTTEMVYILRDGEAPVTVEHETWQMGLFSRAKWLELISAVGFSATTEPIVLAGNPTSGTEIFVGSICSTLPG